MPVSGTHPPFHTCLYTAVCLSQSAGLDPGNYWVSVHFTLQSSRISQLASYIDPPVALLVFLSTLEVFVSMAFSEASWVMVTVSQGGVAQWLMDLCPCLEVCRFETCNLNNHYTVERDH